MNGSASVDEGNRAAGANPRWPHYAALGALCALVIGIYAGSAHSGSTELAAASPRDTYYNLLVQGFRAGQLNVNREAPPELAQLADPYDPVANSPYRWRHSAPLHDMSYYRGKLYLYYGAAPALLLFWPCEALTGRDLFHKDAVAIFFSVGFLAGVGLLWAAWRRYFPDVGIGIVLAGALALGLANFAPAILWWSDVGEVAISCGYALVMLALVGIWGALHQPRRRGWWLAGASLAYGLALGARPSLLFGAAILLVPVAQAWRRKSRPTGGSNPESASAGIAHSEPEPARGRPARSNADAYEGSELPATHGPGSCCGPEGRAPNNPFVEKQRVWPLLLAATGPIVLIGLGLMLYNALRFGNPLEFGQRYQLSGYRQSTMQQFSLHYLWFNCRVGFLEPARWSGHFPFIRDIVVPPLPEGYYEAGHSFGLLTNVPLVWLALAVPLAWRRRPMEARSALRGFLRAAAWLFGVCALTLGLHNSMCLRYEVEFASPLVWLGVIGILGLERALAGRRAWLRAVRCVWGLMLAFSVAFNLLASSGPRADTHFYLGTQALGQGELSAAVAQYKAALEFNPDFEDAHNNLGLALVQQGRVDEAIIHYRKALELQPAYAEARNNLGNALLQKGQVDEAIICFRKALETRPNYVSAHNNLGVALIRKGELDEALAHFEAAAQLDPRNAAAQAALGYVLLRKDRVGEAISHLNIAIGIQPDRVDAQTALGHALLQSGQAREAIAHYQKALELQPDSLDILNQLAWVLATSPDGSLRNGARAVELAAHANRLSGGNDPATLATLAAAQAEAGRFADAETTARRALQLAVNQPNTALAAALQAQIELYQAGSPFRDPGPTRGP